MGGIRAGSLSALVSIGLVGGIAALLATGTVAPAEAADGGVGEARAVSADAVKQEMLHAWNGYRQYAWGHDGLRPLSKGAFDWYRETLLLTPVDALDTLLLMGLTREAGEAKELIFSRLRFDLDLEVQHFEIAIRLLGGLISSYGLDGDRRLLDLAVDLANRLLPVFDSPTGMPYRFVNLETGKTSGRISNPAEIGTYLLEYGELSRLTGNPVYYQKAKRATVALFSRRSKIGLVGASIDVDRGNWLDPDASVGACKDSYYEYLLKGWLLLGDPDLKAMWEAHLPSLHRYLADERNGELWYGHADMNTGARTQTTYGALDAFLPGLLAQAGDLDRAARLQSSGYKMWTLFGIEPEVLDYRSMRVQDGAYPLRPEIIESAYILYHTTGDERYRQMGAVFFENLVKHCRAEAGYAALQDVRTKQRADSMESFFLAETLKYFYLLFSPPGAFDFDAHVLTTEAHPIRISHRPR